MTATARIARLLHTGRGDANGALLDDGTVVRFPPHVGHRMASVLRSGGMLFASGDGTRGAQGNAFEATRLGASASDAQAVLAGPHGPDDPGPRGPRPDAASAAGNAAHRPNPHAGVPQPR